MSNQQPQPKSTSTPKTENPLIETLKTLGLSVVFTFTIGMTVADFYYVPATSMQPTLQTNDRLIIDNRTGRQSQQ
jgi:signal peptidase I